MDLYSDAGKNYYVKRKPTTLFLRESETESMLSILQPKIFHAHKINRDNTYETISVMQYLVSHRIFKSISEKKVRHIFNCCKGRADKCPVNFEVKEIVESLNDKDVKLIKTFLKNYPEILYKVLFIKEKRRPLQGPIVYIKSEGEN